MTKLNDDFAFLPDVPAAHVVGRLAKTDGHELKSGKPASSESSAALAVNTLGWFHERPERLPPFPVLELDHKSFTMGGAISSIRFHGVTSHATDHIRRSR